MHNDLKSLADERQARRPALGRCGWAGRFPLSRLSNASADARAGESDSDDGRVSEFWADQSEKIRTTTSCWVNNDIICSSVNHSLPANRHWIEWLLTEIVGHPNVQNVLSVCCGDGTHELIAMNSGKLGFLRGFDLSEGAIHKANAKFREAGILVDRYLFEVRDANNLDISGTFDLVLSAGAIHHVTNLEDLLAKIAAMLEPDGRLALVEFVGPDRFQWTDDQIEIVNRLLGALDVRYLKGGTPNSCVRPLIEDMIRLDPSEAVRSDANPWSVTALLRGGVRTELARDDSPFTALWATQLGSVEPGPARISIRSSG